MAKLQHIVAEIVRLRTRAPVIVGISGFGGSGKSTLARAIVESVAGAARMRGDDFLDPVRSHQRSTEWDGMERLRLREEVLGPFRAGRPGQFRRFDWNIRQLADPEPIPQADVLIVDAVGLFHPQVGDAFDLTIWVDVDLDTATERGMQRDRDNGHPHADLWREVWVPNERDFVARFDPRARADVLYVPTE